MPEPARYNEFVDLLQHATGQIFAYINALLLNWNDAEDVFQECCVVLWDRFDDFRPGTNFLAWALRIAQNKSMDFQKARARRHASWGSDLQESLMAAMAEPGSGDDGLVALSSCMGRLDEGDRRLVERCYGDCVPVREVATELGRSPQSVHNSLRRIRSVLLECIERVLKREQRR